MKKGKHSMIKQAEADGISMTWHYVLYFVEILLIVRNVMNILYTLHNDASWMRSLDQFFYIILGVLAVLSVYKHDHRVGIVSFLLYIIIDLFMNSLVYFMAKSGNIQSGNIGLQVASLYIGLGLVFVMTILYYRKRWKYFL